MRDVAEQPRVLAQRHDQQRPAPPRSTRLAQRLVRADRARSSGRSRIWTNAFAGHNTGQRGFAGRRPDGGLAHRLRECIGGSPRTATGAESARRRKARTAERGAAQLHRLFQHRVEHRREIAGRGIDDLQYLGGRGLLLQCLARLGQEPRILHRDDRLRREILQQRDLLVGERPHLLAIDADDAEQAFVLAQSAPRTRCGRHRGRRRAADPGSPRRSIRSDATSARRNNRLAVTGVAMSIVQARRAWDRAPRRILRAPRAGRGWRRCGKTRRHRHTRRQMRLRTAASPFRASRRTPARGRRARN